MFVKFTLCTSYAGIKRKGKDSHNIFDKLAKLEEEMEKREQKREEVCLERQERMEEEYRRREQKREERESQMLSLFTNFFGQITPMFQHRPSPHPSAHTQYPPFQPQHHFTHHSPRAPPYHPPVSPESSQYHMSSPQYTFPHSSASFQPTDYYSAPISPDDGEG